jgi:hypothetical protein
MERGTIFIDISINKRVFNFLFSTARHSSISNELINLYDFKSIKNETFYTINEIKIGNSVFKKINAKPLNTEESFGFKCSKLDGIIGSDFLSKLIWRIDYKNKVIIFSESIDNFKFSNNVKKINFITTKNNYTPIISLNINSLKYDNVKISIGSNSTINLTNKNFEDSIVKYKNVKYIGTERFSAKSKSILFTETCVLIPDIKTQNYSLGKNMIVFSENENAFIGNSILKDYQVTIDWKNNILYLDNYTFHENYKIEDYGFYFYKRNEKIEVVGLYIGSNADKQGIKNGDTILKINDIDFTKISEEAIVKR